MIRTRGALYVYDGRELYAVVKHRADAKRVNQIRNHQRQAQTRAAETCRAPKRGVIQAGKHRRLVDNKPEGTGSRVSGQDGGREG